METEAIADEILAVLEQLLQAAGPEGTLEFLQVGLQEMAGGEQPAEMMSQGGPQVMPMRSQAGTMMARDQDRKRNALAQ
jgi:hypothetical protein